MKILKTILVLSFFHSFAFGQDLKIEYENLETLNLKGNVKTILEKSFKATQKNGKILKSGTGWQYDWQNDSEYFFDTFGNLIYKNDVLGSKTKENYSAKLDDQHRIIEINRLYKTIQYEYDSTNRIRSSKVINRQPAVISTGKEKPTAGNGTNIKYFYDSNNLLIKKEGYRYNSKFSVETFKYDAFNNLILCEIKQDSLIETHRYQYNDQNLVMKYVWSDNEEGIAEITTYEYLDKIKILEHWVLFTENEPDGYIDDHFENGNIIKSTEVEEDGSITDQEIYNYTYDSQNNWIQKIMNVNDEFFIVEREIEYYSN